MRAIKIIKGALIILLGFMNIFYSNKLIKCNRPENSNKLSYPLDKPKNSVRVMQYNIRGELKIDRERGNSWDIRKYKIKKLVDSYKPDIIGMQEVSANYIPDLVKLFNNYEIIAFDIDINKDKDVAILFSKQRFNLVEHNYFCLSQETDDICLPEWDSRHPRIVVWAKLFDKINKQQLVVFSSHFDSRGPQSRIESARLIPKKMLAITADVPSILIGDFNLIPDVGGQEAYQEFVNTNIIKDVRDDSTKYYGPDGTWIGWPYDSYAVKPGQVGARLDHIFVRNIKTLFSGVLEVKIDDSGNIITRSDINKDKFDSLSYLSDHLPVMADLSFNNNVLSKSSN